MMSKHPEYHCYKLTNTQTNRAYIGITTNPTHRKWQHFNRTTSSPEIGDDMVKFGREAFTFEIIRSGMSEIEASMFEIERIIYHGTLSPNGYNLSPGGRVRRGGAPRWSELSRKKIRGEKCWKAKLTEDQVIAILCDSRTRKEIATAYKIAEMSVSNIKSRSTWAHLPLPEGYVPLRKNHKLTEDQRRVILESTESYSIVARKFGVSPMAIWHIKNNAKTKLINDRTHTRHLTEDERNYIRDSDETSVVLAHQFGLHPITIHKIRHQPKTSPSSEESTSGESASDDSISSGSVIPSRERR